jgi:hypothetical protein
MNVTKVFHIKALRELTDEVINKRIWRAHNNNIINIDKKQYGANKGMIGKKRTIRLARFEAKGS